MIEISNSKIPILYNIAYLNKSIRNYILWDIETHPHLLCVGNTGSGKTYALSLILGKISKYLQPVRIIICDYKKSGFSIYEDCNNSFYGYENVFNGIQMVFEEFSRRLEANDEERNRQKLILLIDEFGAFISSLEKKANDEAKKMVGNMLLMGRTLGVHIIIGIQRADAEFFKTGTRDQFGAILMLGNLSKEQKLMLASDYRDEMTAQNERGQGYLLLDGKGLYHVQVPTVKNHVILEQTIRQSM